MKFLTDLSNRVKHQKRNQPAIEKWPFGFVFGVQLGLRQKQALINTYDITLIHHHCNVINHPSWLDIRRISPEYQAMMDDGRHNNDDE